MSRIAKTALVAALLLTSAGCGSDESVHVPGKHSGAVRLAKGERLVVDLGNQNSSVGDGWFLVTPPDKAVLTDAGEKLDTDCGKPGCGAKATWLFSTAGAGKTALTLRYCYRSRPPNCDPMAARGPADPVTLTVTVTKS
jgi:predicted secreted protein